MDFYSPTKGKLSFEAVFEDITRYSNENPEDKYKLIIGTDSHAYTNRSVVFVTAIIIHRIGKGGRFYYRKRRTSHMESLRQRIYYEDVYKRQVLSRASFAASSPETYRLLPSICRP